MTRPPKPSLVSITGGRGRRVYKGRDGVAHVYHVCDRDKDAALVAAYVEVVGKQPRNDPQKWAQFTHSPHKRNRARVLEGARA